MPAGRRLFSWLIRRANAKSTGIPGDKQVVPDSRLPHTQGVAQTELREGLPVPPILL